MRYREQIPAIPDAASTVVASADGALAALTADYGEYPARLAVDGSLATPANGQNSHGDIAGQWCVPKTWVAFEWRFGRHEWRFLRQTPLPESLVL
jgi:hypothetical protein